MWNVIRDETNDLTAVYGRFCKNQMNLFTKKDEIIHCEYIFLRNRGDE